MSPAPDLTSHIVRPHDNETRLAIKGHLDRVFALRGPRHVRRESSPNQIAKNQQDRHKDGDKDPGCCFHFGQMMMRLVHDSSLSNETIRILNYIIRAKAMCLTLRGPENELKLAKTRLRELVTYAISQLPITSFRFQIASRV